MKPCSFCETGSFSNYISLLERNKKISRLNGSKISRKIELKNEIDGKKVFSNVTETGLGFFVIPHNDLDSLNCLSEIDFGSRCRYIKK